MEQEQKNKERVNRNEKSHLRCSLEQLYTYLGFIGALGCDVITTHLRSRASQGVISPIEKAMLDNLFQYLGNFKYGIALGFIFNLYCMMKEKTNTDMSKIEKKLLTVVIPAILFTLLSIYNIDTETFQRLPGSFGSPFLQDIPAGAIGALFGAVTFEYLTARRAQTQKKEESSDSS